MTTVVSSVIARKILKAFLKLVVVFLVCFFLAIEFFFFQKCLVFSSFLLLSYISLSIYFLASLYCKQCKAPLGLCVLIYYFFIRYAIVVYPYYRITYRCIS